METLLQHKRQIENLEVECCVLRQHISNLTRNPQSTTSNFKMYVGSSVEEHNEESSIHQMPREVDEMDQDPEPSLVKQEEANNMNTLN